MTVLGGNIHCDNCTFFNNEEVFQGGNEATYVRVTNSVFDSNMMVIDDYQLSGPKASNPFFEFENCTFQNNIDTFVCIQSGMSVVSSTFLDSDRNFLMDRCILEVVDCQIVEKVPDGIAIDSGSVLFRNTLIRFYEENVDEEMANGMRARNENGLVADEVEGFFYVISISSLDSFVLENTTISNAKVNFSDTKSISFTRSTFQSSELVVDSGIMATQVQAAESFLSDASVSFSNSLVTLTDSAFSNYTIISNFSTILFKSSVSITSDYRHTSPSAPFVLCNSTMQIYNSAVIAGSYDSNDWVRCYNDSVVWGDVLEWKLSSECEATSYQPLTLSSTNPKVVLIYSGNMDQIELQLDDTEAGVNVTITTESDVSYFPSPSPSPSPKLMISDEAISVYLVPSPCTLSMVVSSETNYTSTELLPSQSTTTYISFVGPSPSFLRPSNYNSSSLSSYCILMNSTSGLHSGSLVRLSANFIKRQLTTSAIEFKPSVSIYSTVFTVDYALFDQWGDPFAPTKRLQLLSSACNNEGVCGLTEESQSSGEVLIKFNTTISWRLSTPVNISLMETGSATAHSIILLHYFATC